jgi:formyl-CoA transferase
MSGPLEGIRVLELGQLIAGPFAAKMLAEFGAEVIKIEPPVKGDPLRKWRLMHDGTAVWWQVQSRNKKSITLDLRQAEAQDVVRRLVKEVDVVIENFKPGTMEDWGLGWEDLKAINPKLVMLRVSGYGQTGPYRDRPGFGVVGEAMGGLRHLSGEPGRTPVRVGVSIGDSLSALHGVIGVLLALRARDGANGEGQMIDVALYESVFNMMESLLPEYAVFNEVRQPAGSSLPGIAPSNAYRCKDGKFVLIAGNGDSIFKRLMTLIGREDLGRDPALESNDGRVPQVGRIDDAISAWAREHELDEVLQALNEQRIPAGKIYDVADIATDPHYLARDMILESHLPDGTPIKLPGIVPKLSGTPGEVRSAAPTLGQHTDEILSGLGIDEQTRAEWRQRGIV